MSSPFHSSANLEVECIVFMTLIRDIILMSIYLSLFDNN